MLLVLIRYRDDLEKLLIAKTVGFINLGEAVCSKPVTILLKIRHENNNLAWALLNLEVNVQYSIYARILFPYIHVAYARDDLCRIIRDYHIAGKFGGELNLAVWRSSLQPPNKNPPIFYTCIYMYTYGRSLTEPPKFKSANIFTMAT